MILQDAFVFRKSAGAFLRIRFCIIEKVWNTVILPSVHSNTLLRRFPVNGNSLFLIIQKTVPDSSSETVIITYYRGTTQFGVSPTFARTIIRSGLITGSVPGVSYYTITPLFSVTMVFQIRPQKSIRHPVPCCDSTTHSSL